MKKILILTIALTLFLTAGVLAVTITNYQENANSYSYLNSGYDNRFVMDYSKPFQSTSSSIWKIKYKDSQEIITEDNINIPPSCWTWNPTQLKLAILERGSSDYNVLLQCYNGSWVDIKDLGKDNSNSVNLLDNNKVIDGDWTTSSGVQGASANNLFLWDNLSSGISVYEEAMIWNIVQNNFPVENNVHFNGDWEPGTTLYSNWVTVSNYFYGKDAYPIRDSTQNQRQKVCTTEYREKRSRVCHYEIINNKKKRICETEITLIPYQKCKYFIINPVKIGCLNPNGVYTNQLSLYNFYYSFDGINWNNIPYPNDKISTINSQVIFKVEIPEICSPAYTINSAVYIG